MKLIKLVEIDLDYCANRFGELLNAPNNMPLSETFIVPSIWTLNSVEIVQNVGKFPETLTVDRLINTNSIISGSGAAATFAFDAVDTTTYCWSAMVEAESCDIVNIRLFAGTAAALVHYDLTAGVATAEPAGGIIADPLDYGMEDLGNGIWRCWLSRVCNASVNGAIGIFFADTASGFFQGDSLKISGMQFEEASAPTTYVRNLGAGTCTASGSGDAKCHNVLIDCQDTANYTPYLKTYTYYQNIGGVPKSVIGIPALVDVDYIPSEIVSGQALGTRPHVTAKLIDFPHHDRGIDLYASERTYNPLRRGTYFGKYRARNPYHLGRPFRMYEGGIPWDDNKSFDEQPYISKTDFYAGLTKHTFIIEQMEGPDVDGSFNIIAKDPLKFADDDRATAPLLSTGYLSAELLDDPLVDLTFSLLPVGIGDLEYDASGIVTLGSETMDFTRVGDDFTVVRARYGTAISTHAVDDTVQQGLIISGKNIAFIADLLLRQYAGIDAQYIPVDKYEIEVLNYLPNLYNAYIPRPIAVRKLLNELTDEAGFDFSYDPIKSEIVMHALRPASSATEIINDDTWMVDGSFEVTERPEERLSRVWISYGIVDLTGELDNPSNYNVTLARIDLTAESPTQYGQPAIRQIYSRWINAFGKDFAQQAITRILSNKRDLSRIFRFDTFIDKEQFLKMGDFRRMTHRTIQDVSGAPEVIDVRILSSEPVGGVVTVKAEERTYFQDPDDFNRNITVPDTADFNLRTAYESLYGEPDIAYTVWCYVDPDTSVGASSTTLKAFNVGDWPVGMVINIVIHGFVVGAGGKGGDSGAYTTHPGFNGGLAFYTRFPVNIDNQGVIGGGGGGGGAGDWGDIGNGYILLGGGGGGGAGYFVGAGGAGNAEKRSEAGQNGTLQLGGAGGRKSQVLTDPKYGHTDGARGGDLGTVGGTSSTGTIGDGSGPSAGGAAGGAIDGESYITWVELVGDAHDPEGIIYGTRIN